VKPVLDNGQGRQNKINNKTNNNKHNRITTKGSYSIFCCLDKIDLNIDYKTQ
jgi:hypothetical protein